MINIPLTDLSAIGDLYDADLLHLGGKVIAALRNEHLKRGQMQPASSIGQDDALTDSNPFDRLFAAVQSIAGTL
ncbi:hypothetical protein QU481_19635 [Crenobacter sp. SG2303]|uniref:Uncharacterized protein n=1 Tax=Crenobacter oryzisoli TaxID=3056844 RepID=A0ABT7XTK7_9NEIS|nr:hypothetical protein [Crenobacter sp. SG2303]MDN0077060.1 hypothetical protein [Crenobacter sp. SG2303]